MAPTLLFVSWMTSEAGVASAYHNAYLWSDHGCPRTWPELMTLQDALREETGARTALIMAWRPLDPSDDIPLPGSG